MSSVKVYFKDGTTTEVTEYGLELLRADAAISPNIKDVRRVGDKAPAVILPPKTALKPEGVAVVEPEVIEEKPKAKAGRPKK